MMTNHKNKTLKSNAKNGEFLNKSHKLHSSHIINMSVTKKGNANS